ncbi:hypothetical protein WOLCODRAFT_138344 [Wolfiporia cocos MD-104 SS10]|uniref:Uncharacterized protein n=1 Tax=Wolfiporia cocos (strain MD-104) TaxID=742152 RepID=A0A2H3JNH5_WOLCO|nr:hypothetical protein WOLCODRAFT_138344 [Wolfiporia cocos MD-104 SS10]
MALVQNQQPTTLMGFLQWMSPTPYQVSAASLDRSVAPFFAKYPRDGTVTLWISVAPAAPALLPLPYVPVPQNLYQSTSMPYQGCYAIVFSKNGYVGVNSADAYNNRMDDLDSADDCVFEEMSGSRPSCRIEPIFGEALSHQFWVKRKGRSITRRELVRQIAKEVKRYLQDVSLRNDPIPIDHVIILGVTKVSDASVQPELAVC